MPHFKAKQKVQCATTSWESSSSRATRTQLERTWLRFKKQLYPVSVVTNTLTSITGHLLDVSDSKNKIQTNVKPVATKRPVHQMSSLGSETFLRAAEEVWPHTAEQVCSLPISIDLTRRQRFIFKVTIKLNPHITTWLAEITVVT